MFLTKEEQFKGILKFLKLVHPNLEKDDYAIEIRPIQRGEYSYKHSSSLNLWRYDKKSLSFLERFLDKHYNEPNCLYYSVFRFDTSIKSKTMSGREASHGKITSMSAKLAETIVFDFDNIGESRRQELVIMFEKYNLKLSWIFTGNGFHGLIHLSNNLTDPHLIKKLVSFFNNEGFDIDSSCVDAARIMRLPYTYNYKDINNPKIAELVEISNSRYSVEYLLSLVNPTTQNDTFGNLSQPNNLKQLSKSNKPKEAQILSNYDFPEAIRNMLDCVPKGFRNTSLGFLTGFLKNNLGFGYEQLYSIMSEWAELSCKPSYTDYTFKKDFNRFYFSGCMPYSASLANKFGFIDFKEYASIQKDHSLFLNTKLFECIKTPGELRTVLMIKLLEHEGHNGVSTNELVAWSKKNLKYKDNGLSINTIRKDIQQATKNNLIYKTHGNRKFGKPDLYYSNELFDLSSGYFLLPVNDANTFLSFLNLSQLSLYVYLSYLQSFGVNFISQKKLANKLNLSRSRVSTLIRELEDNKFIRVERAEYGEAVRFCKYTLLK